jgi:hypothetical protein
MQRRSIFLIFRLALVAVSASSVALAQKSIKPEPANADEVAERIRQFEAGLILSGVLPGAEFFLPHLTAPNEPARFDAFRSIKPLRSGAFGTLDFAPTKGTARPKQAVSSSYSGTSGNRVSKTLEFVDLRGGMIDDLTDDLGQPKVTVGMTKWRAEENATTNMDSVSAKLSIKEPEITATLNVQRSTLAADAALEVTLQLTGLPKAQISVPRVRRSGERGGEPLDMVMRPTGDDSYLLVLSGSAEAERNVIRQLLADEWIDIPVRQGERSFVLTMEKGRPA